MIIATIFYMIINDDLSTLVNSSYT